MNDILRRKVARAAMAGPEGGPGADHGWRLAFARAARDGAGLTVEVQAMTLHRRSLAELLELPPDRAMLALLDGPQGGLGLVAMSSEVMGALIEMQTTGRVSAVPPLARKPTRTDAAMVAGVIDRALEELEQVLAQEADLVWAGGFRYASFLEDPRPLGLLLEDQPFRVLSATLSLAGGARTGGLILALPADGRGHRPIPKVSDADRAAAAAPSFGDAMGAVILDADCVLQAVIARVNLPLRDVMDLKVDLVLPLADATLDRIGVEGIDGRQVATARLGQQRGLRALRLSDEAAAGLAKAAAPKAGGPKPGGPTPLPTGTPPVGHPPGQDEAAGGRIALMPPEAGLQATG